MSAFKEQCIALRKKDFSLLEIAKITGRPKTSVYFHIRGIPLSEGKMREVWKAHGERIRLFPLQRKGKSARNFRIFSQWNRAMVFLVAHFIFDGELNRGCLYNNRNESLIRAVEEQMRKIYAYPPARYVNPLTGVVRIGYYNVALCSYLKEKAEELLNDVGTFRPDLKKEFLKAFFDDEGCMDFRPTQNRRSIRGYQKNIKILDTVHSLLSDFNIGASIQKPNEVVISGRENLERFQKEIGFSPGVRINGLRSNSIWKKHLEKRDLLDRAIASFKN